MRNQIRNFLCILLFVFAFTNEARADDTSYYCHCYSPPINNGDGTITTSCVEPAGGNLCGSGSTNSTIEASNLQTAATSCNNNCGGNISYNEGEEPLVMLNTLKPIFDMHDLFKFKKIR